MFLFDCVTYCGDRHMLRALPLTVLRKNICVLSNGIFFVIYLNSFLVGFEVLTVVVINIAIVWDIAPCSPFVNRRFGETSPGRWR
jgi:hypothetical protein